MPRIANQGRSEESVIPAKAGIHLDLALLIGKENGFPAFAGMTAMLDLIKGSLGAIARAQLAASAAKPDGNRPDRGSSRCRRDSPNLLLLAESTRFHHSFAAST